MIKKKILMMLALLLTAVTGAWADVSTLYADGVFTGFTATSGTGDNYQNLVDGNKRTARITSNAILIANGYCPLSFRSVDSIDYKKAMLIFYEQNNLYAFKQIFIDQFEFAVREYF